jgi:hypothetical protein
LKHFASPDFWDALAELPAETQHLAHAQYELLRTNPRHPSLHLKRVRGYWSVRIGRHYRALGIDEDGGILWGWIGSHAEYDRITG